MIEQKEAENKRNAYADNITVITAKYEPIKTKVYNLFSVSVKHFSLISSILYIYAYLI